MEKTYVFDSGSGSTGFDPNLFAALNNNGGFGGNNGFWWIFLFALLWGRNGFGNFGGENLNNGYGNGLVMQAVQGNRTAISELASTLNCSIGQVNTVLGQIQSTVQSVGAQNNLSFAQTINAIQSGDSNIVSQMQSCCCDIKQAISGVNIGLERGFSAVAYETADSIIWRRFWPRPSNLKRLNEMRKIIITTERKEEMSSLVDKMLRIGGKLMQCFEDMEEDSLGMRESRDDDFNDMDDDDYMGMRRGGSYRSARRDSRGRYSRY